MKYIRDLGFLFLYCLLTLFHTPPDFFYILAFLAALIVCCMDSFLDLRAAIIPIIALYLTAAFISPVFLYFFPTITYILFRHKRYILILLGGLFYLYFLNQGTINLFSFTWGLLGFFLSFYFLQDAERYEQLDSLYRHTRDDSKELNLLLTEKNHTLLEKQDYEIYTATLRERNRIAREIHDNVGHLLSRSILMVGALKAVNNQQTLEEPLDTLEISLNSAMDSIRSSVHDLHDEAINLEEVINSLLKEFHFCPVSFHYDMGRDIPRDIKYSFISITKEALSNIIKHSNATNVNVLMREHPALYQLCIEDNGSDAAFSESGIGLVNMKERVHGLKGNIQILNEKGVKIFITIPKEI